MSPAGAMAVTGTITRGGCDPWNTLRGEPPDRFQQGSRLDRVILDRVIADCRARKDAGAGRVARFLIMR